MKRLALYFTLVCLAAAVQAQNNSLGSSGYYAELGSGIGVWSLINSKTDFTTRDIIITNGYDLNDRFSVKFPLTFSSGMFKTENEKRHEMCMAVGTGVGYNFIVKPSYRWQVTIETGYSWDKNWEFSYYDAAGKCYLGAREDRINGILGVGIRLIDSDAKGSPNYLTPYFTIGFRINN